MQMELNLGKQPEQTKNEKILNKIVFFCQEYRYFDMSTLRKYEYIWQKNYVEMFNKSSVKN